MGARGHIGLVCIAGSLEVFFRIELLHGAQSIFDIKLLVRNDMISLAARLDEFAVSLITGARLNTIEQLFHIEDLVLILAWGSHLLRAGSLRGRVTELVHSLSHLALAAVFTSVEKAIRNL